MEILLNSKLSDNIRIGVCRVPVSDSGSRHNDERQAISTLLEHLLPDTGGKYSHTDTGAPFLPAIPELSLSISHSHGMAAIALSAGSTVGIDIEMISPRIPRIAPRIMGTPEQQAAAAWHDSTLAHTLVWTAKEAMYKAMLATGIDFARDICISLPHGMDAHGFTSYSAIGVGGKEYTLYSAALPADTPTHILTVAYIDKKPFTE